MKSVNIKRSIIVLALAVSYQMAGTSVYAGGIPVIDVSSLAQQIEQVVSWGKQLQAMKDQYAQQLTQYQSMTGKRGFGGILNDPKLRQYLPPDAQKVYSQMMRPQQPNMNTLCHGRFGDALSLCQAAAQKHYVDRTNYEQAYNTATSEQIQIQSLIDQISVADDPKAIAELQARMAGEQAKIQNSLVQLQLSTQLAEIQNKLLQQTQHEAFVKHTNDEAGKPLIYPDPITNWN